jgi:hypothetical protein
MKSDMKEIKEELSRLKDIESKYNSMEALLQQILASQQAVASQVACKQSGGSSTRSRQWQQ